MKVNVALNDDISIDKDVPNTTSVIFQVFGDDKLLWTSKPITDKGELDQAEVSILDMNTLELRVTDNSEDGNITHAHAVWSVALVECQSPYRRWYRNVYSEPSPVLTKSVERGTEKMEEYVNRFIGNTQKVLSLSNPF